MKPILFNTSMVHAILDNRKTMTRRVIKPQPNNEQRIDYCEPRKEWAFMRGWALVDRIIRSPYQKGDILYVRETFFEYKGRFYYKADGKHEALAQLGISFKWRPSIHMPREAARIFLRVTNISVAKLQDITDEQAKAEGANFCNRHHVGVYEKMRRSAVERFAEIWNSTIKKSDRNLYSWEANPYVWVIEFERISREEAIGK